MPPSQGCCSHDHDCEAEDCGASFSLYKYVDTYAVRCLNEEVEGSCRHVFKPWSDRLQRTGPVLKSQPEDTDLLIHVPFTGAVKLKAICIIGGPDGSSPDRLKVYINRDDLDFSIVSELAPVQEWELRENLDGFMEYPTQVHKFNGVHSIDLYIPSNFGADQTEITYIGFKGDFTERTRGPVEATYEVKPMPADHAVHSDLVKNNFGI